MPREYNKVPGMGGPDISPQPKAARSGAAAADQFDSTLSTRSAKPPSTNQTTKAANWKGVPK